MFDIGWTELLFLGVLAILVVGPKDLPRMMRTIGQYTAKIRGAAREFQRSFDEMARESELDELRKQIAEVKANNPVTQVKEAIKHPLDSVGKALDDAGKPLPGLPDEMVGDAAEAAADIDASRAPLLEHLIELRQRLLYSIVAIAVAFVVCFYFADQVFNILLIPFERAVGDASEVKLIFTAPQEYFFTQLKLALFGALFIAFPVLAAQIYMFVAPGLYKNERGAFLPFLIATPVLFLMGASLVFFLIMPLALGFFLGMEQTAAEGQAAIELLPRVSEYLGLTMTLIFAFGLCFQLPVLMTLLGRAGLITSAQLRKGRKYAVVGVFAVAAILTPPDIISQLGLGLPTLVLYEISILSVALIERRRKEDSAEKDETADGEAAPSA
eukprot:s1_g1932.t1